MFRRMLMRPSSLLCILFLCLLPAPAVRSDELTLDLHTVRYELDGSGIYLPMCGVADKLGYVYVGGVSDDSNGLFRFDGARWQKCLPRATYLAVTEDGTGYGYGSGFFRWTPTTSSTPPYTLLTDMLRESAPESADIAVYRDLASVGNEVFLSQTWHIVRAGVDAEGNDYMRAIHRKDTIPDHLKFRRVFNAGGRAMVQVEDMKNPSKTSFGWLTADDQIELIPGLTIEDHVMKCYGLPPKVGEKYGEDAPWRFFAFGVKEMWIVDGHDVTSITPRILKEQERFKLAAVPLDAGKFACMGRSLGVVIFDDQGNFVYRKPNESSWVGQRMGIFYDQRGHLWHCVPGEVIRIDLGGPLQWKMPRDVVFKSMAMADDQVLFQALPEGYYLTDLSWSTAGKPSFGSLTTIPIFPKYHEQGTARAGGLFFIGAQEGLFWVSEELKKAVWLKEEDSEVLHFDESTNTLYTFSGYHDKGSTGIKKLTFLPDSTNGDESRNDPRRIDDDHLIRIGDRLVKYSFIKFPEHQEPGNGQSQFKKAVCPHGDPRRGKIWFSILGRERSSTLFSLDIQTDNLQSHNLDARPFPFEGEILFAEQNEDTVFRINESGQYEELEEFRELGNHRLFLKDYRLKVTAAHNGDAILAIDRSPLQRLFRDPATLKPRIEDFLSRSRSGADFAIQDKFNNVWSAVGNHLVIHPAEASDDHPEPFLAFGRVAMIDSQIKSSGDRNAKPGDPVTYTIDLPMNRVAPWKDSTEFDYSQGTFRVEFSLVNALIPEKTRYSTRMVNLNDAWSSPSKEPYRTFPALREGQYRFEVRAVTAEGTSIETATLDIIVHPPWFRATWFYSLIVAGVLLTFAGLMRWRVRSHAEQAEWQAQQVALLSVEVAERKKTEARLKEYQEAVIEKEKDQAVASIAAGLAHDVNNYLSPVTIYSELLQTESVANNADEVQKLGRIIEHSSHDASQLIRQLHPMFRQKSENITTVNLQNIVGEVADLARGRLSEYSDKTITFIHSAEPHDIQIDEADLRNILLNLANNAIDSIEESGNVMVNARLDSGEFVFEVSDTGCGMTKEAVASCMDPFFTTKGKLGTGLGLANCKVLVELNEGRIEVMSELGRGTTFRVSFPGLSEIQTGANRIRIDDSHGGLHSTFRIVLVDDFQPTADALAAILESDGHMVFQADGLEAVNCIQKNDVSILLTDYRMPGISGYELCRRVRKEHPSVHCILMSGYEEPGVREACDVFLQKPVSHSQLRAAIQESARCKLNSHRLESARTSQDDFGEGV